MTGATSVGARPTRAAPPAARRLAVRVLLGVLAVSALVPGAWAALVPRSFQRDFPGLGQHWVELAGPFSGHLVGDVGAFYLAFGALLAWAAVRPDRALVVPLCLAWSGFSVLHLGWHLAHLDGFDAAAAAGQTVSLAVVLALPAAVLWVGRPRPGDGAAAASRA